MSGNVIDLSAHVDAASIEVSRRDWDTATTALSGKSPLKAIASRVLLDIDYFRVQALNGRHVGLMRPIVQIEETNEIVIALAINAFKVDQRPYQVLRFTYEPVRDELPSKMAPRDVGDHFDRLFPDRFVYQHTSTIATLCKVPILAFGRHFDGRVTEASAQANGWAARLFARYPTPGKCVQLVVEYEARRLHELDAAIKGLDPSRR